MALYIYQRRDWPKFTWRYESIEQILGTVRHHQGRLLGRMEALGFPLRSEAMLQALTLEALKSNEIEGEILNPGKSVLPLPGAWAWTLPGSYRLTEMWRELLR
jgi:Fic family protein